jgi:hypothetical protein
MNSSIKKIMMHVLVAFILLSPLLVLADIGSSGGGLVPCDGPDCNYEQFLILIKRVIMFLIELGVAFSAVVFAYAGWLYMTSGGDEGKVKQAHEMLTKVLWGFLFALGAFLIVQLISTQLGYTNI